MPAQRCSIVEICSPVPSAVPPVTFEGFLQVRGMLPPTCASSLLAAAIGERSERRQRFMKKPTKPYTLTFATHPHPIHTVVPVSGSHQRQTVTANRETCFQRTSAMFVERSFFL